MFFILIDRVIMLIFDFSFFIRLIKYYKFIYQFVIYVYIINFVYIWDYNCSMLIIMINFVVQAVFW